MNILFITAALVLPLANTPAPPATPPRTQVDNLKDWAMARCIARGAAAPFAKDAAISAAALLEQGDYGIEAYEAIEALVGRQLAKKYGGSVSGDYITLKCLDLRRSAELDRLVRRQKATPVR